MTEIRDFSKCKKSEKYFGGSERKIGLVIDGNQYMVKFQKETEFGKRNNHISEFLGSHIFQMLGFETQETLLGKYHDQEVVACKNFVLDGYQFVPFNDVGESTLDQDKESYQYSYEDIMQMLKDNSKLTNVQETIDSFWKIFIVDAFIGNFDRHGGNWGFLKKNNEYTLAPVFDNGSSLFPNLTDKDEMIRIINSEEETNKRVYTFPTSQIKLHGKKSSYYEVIDSLEFDACNKALIEVFENINLNIINKFIDNEVPLIDEIQKSFYKHMINNRYNKILKPAYEKLVNR